MGRGMGPRKEGRNRGMKGERGRKEKNDDDSVVAVAKSDG